MNRINWYINRLRAMNPHEILWRLDQKRIQKKEEHIFGKQEIPVCQKLFYPDLSSLHFDENNLGINFKNQTYKTQTEIHLLGPFKYQDYKQKWHSGFQTNQTWPLKFSYHLGYKQCDRIGDARTNWELNRHFQFVLLAKAFYVTNDRKFITELKSQWEDWNKSNPFLHGISWTSVMEVAIRSISWMLTLGFLKKSAIQDISLQQEIETGILNMTGYLTAHYSRFSSANNHLIVEATAIGLAGFCFNHKPWKDLSENILSTELSLQNYKDGVNKELSLHYQTFVMEAYALMAHCMQANGDSIPPTWEDMLEKMCEYVSHCLWNEQIACEFGDNDEGKILDLEGGNTNHYSYVLQFCSLVLNKRFHGFSLINETIYWLFPQIMIDSIKSLPLYDNSQSKCFEDGGNSFLKDNNNRVLIGIDHAALGFGSIAAHGHADALSFQMLIYGIPIFIDPGTYIYHCNLKARNEFRKTINHNTICINQQDQSEMLGAFLWGKKAKCILDSFHSDENKDILTAHHNGYAPITHQRTYEWDKVKLVLQITDIINKESDWCTTFMLNNCCEIQQKQKSEFHILINDKTICKLTIKSPVKDTKIEKAYISKAYGIIEETKAIRLYGKEKEIITKIEIINCDTSWTERY